VTVSATLAIRVALAAELRITNREGRAKARAWDGPEYMKDEDGHRSAVCQGIIDQLRSGERLTGEMQVAMANQFSIQVDAAICRLGQELGLSCDEIDVALSQILVQS